MHKYQNVYISRVSNGFLIESLGMPGQGKYVATTVEEAFQHAKALLEMEQESFARMPGGGNTPEPCPHDEGDDSPERLGWKEPAEA